MNIKNVIEAWNAKADEHNQWESLDADERVNFALLLQQISDKYGSFDFSMEEISDS